MARLPEVNEEARSGLAKLQSEIQKELDGDVNRDDVLTALLSVIDDEGGVVPGDCHQKVVEKFDDGPTLAV